MNESLYSVRSELYVPHDSLRQTARAAQPISWRRQPMWDYFGHRYKQPTWRGQKVTDLWSRFPMCHTLLRSSSCECPMLIQLSWTSNDPKCPKLWISIPLCRLSPMEEWQACPWYNSSQEKTGPSQTGGGSQKHWSYTPRRNLKYRSVSILASNQNEACISCRLKPETLTSPDLANLA